MNEPNTELVKHEPQAITINADDPTTTLLQMVQSTLTGGVTKEGVEVTEKLLALFERMDAKKAEKVFNVELKACQSEIRAQGLQANQAVPNNDGGVRYKFLDYDGLMKGAGPALDRHGFSVSFEIEYDNGKCYAVCELRHVAGHAARKRCGVDPGQGPPKSSASQKDGAAITYAKRLALVNWLNISVGRDTDGAEPDDDARAIGAMIDSETAKKVRDRLLACGGSEIDFLKFATGVALSDQAGADEILFTYHKIPKSKMTEIEASLARKEGKSKK